jgi:prepilin-type processing-associated H-X9-DG protein
LTCPNFQPHDSKRQFALNEYLAGGDRTGSQPGGTYGMLVVPSPQPTHSEFSITQWDPAQPTKTGYRLGAKLDRFNNSQFMIVEQEHAASYTSNTPSGIGGGDGKVTLGGGGRVGDSVYEPYSRKSGGELSFRHPYFEKANFLFVDGHVDPLRPSDDVWSARRYDIQNK